MALGIVTVAGRELLPHGEFPIAVPEQLGAVTSVCHHPWMPWIGIVFEQGALVWNRDGNALVSTCSFARAVKRGGFYPDRSRMWTLPVAASDSVDWGIWNHETGVYRELELERMGHYGRGAALHPTGRLIGACWSAYGCGYLLQRERPDGGMGYYEAPATERSEYEAYLPAFSPDGARLALVCNPFLAYHLNHGLVCVYDVETGELLCEFRTGTASLQESGLKFARGGERLAYCVPGCRLRIHDPTSGRLLHEYQHSTTLRCPAFHPLYGLYAVEGPDGIAVLVEEDPLEATVEQAGVLAERARGVADRFIAANASRFYAVGAYPEDPGALL